MKRNEEFLRNMFAKGPFERHGYCCEPPIVGICEHPDYDFTLSEKPVRNWVPWVVENYERQLRLLEEVDHDNVPCARMTTGTHIYAAAFGCEVHRFADSNACALPLVHSSDEADGIEEPDIWKSPALYRIFELARAVETELGKNVYLGPPDIQSGFDTAALIWEKSDFLCSIMLDETKDSVKRLVTKCAGLLKTFITEFRKEFPNCSACHCPSVWSPPEMAPWLSNDECGAFSQDVFVEFCLPELQDLAETFGGLGMHCCADAEHQFELFKRIPGFYGFNRVAASKGWDPLTEHFGGPEAPVHVLAWIDEEAIVRLRQNAPAGTRFIFELMGAECDDAKSWLSRMRQTDESSDQARG
ncbi:MAG: hypothetical protein E4H02_06745 [Lentisphaerales bacterium]|nr:MAG: hypothetical protein E4H02_06745 [Lentisphaerales bacterium]